MIQKLMLRSKHNRQTTVYVDFDVADYANVMNHRDVVLELVDDSPIVPEGTKVLSSQHFELILQVLQINVDCIGYVNEDGIFEELWSARPMKMALIANNEDDPTWEVLEVKSAPLSNFALLKQEYIEAFIKQFREVQAVKTPEIITTPHCVKDLQDFAKSMYWAMPNDYEIAGLYKRLQPQSRHPYPAACTIYFFLLELQKTLKEKDPLYKRVGELTSNFEQQFC